MSSEASIGRREDGMLLADAQQSAELARLDAEVAKLQQQLATITPELAAAQKAWEAAAAAGQHGPNAPVPPKEILDLVKIDPEKRTDPQKQQLTEYYRQIAPQLADVPARAWRRRPQAKAVARRPPSRVAWCRWRSPRVRSAFCRAATGWTRAARKSQPALPAFLPGPKIEGRRLTRLDLAQWLVVARKPADRASVCQPFVEAVLRDRHLSRKLDDLGSQGEWPTHPAVARLARLRVHGQWLGREAHGSHDRHQSDLPPSFHGHRRSSWPAIQRTACWRGRAGSGWMPSWSATTPWRSPACWCRKSAARASSRTSQPAIGRT